jgi:8-oxo-dGTP diphosphatase
MGFLNVLEEYRRKGYAQAVSYSMINQLRIKREIPFVHIEESNIKSMKLTLKMGFLKDRIINWFGV